MLKKSYRFVKRGSQNETLKVDKINTFSGFCQKFPQAIDEVKKIFLANFQILGPLGCQGWVVIPQNVKKIQNHCTLMNMYDLILRRIYF
jgi:hypothetical protein